MPTSKDVADVIAQWSGARPDKTTQDLEEWWNQTAPDSDHSGITFSDGVSDLIIRLKEAFPGSPVLSAKDFKDPGTIKTVQDLIDALQPVAAESDAPAPNVPVIRHRKATKNSAPQRKKAKSRKNRAGVDKRKSGHGRIKNRAKHVTKAKSKAHQRRGNRNKPSRK